MFFGPSRNLSHRPSLVGNARALHALRKQNSVIHPKRLKSLTLCDNCFFNYQHKLKPIFRSPRWFTFETSCMLYAAGDLFSIAFNLPFVCSLNYVFLFLVFWYSLHEKGTPAWKIFFYRTVKHFMALFIFYSHRRNGLSVISYWET